MRLDGPLWRYALRLYAMPGVAPACLALQERLGLDVPLLIAVLHARRQGFAVDAAGIARLDAAVADWRRDTIAPLRTIRQRMKSHPWMAHAPIVPACRDSVKALELQAEQIALAVLEQEIATLPPAPGAGAADFLALIRLTCGHFTPGAPEAPEMRLIAEAAAQP